MKLYFKEAAWEEMKEVADIYNEFLISLRDITLDQYFDFEDLSLEERTKLLQERLENDRGQVILVRDGDKADEIIAFISFSIINCFLVVSSVKEIGYIDGAYVKEGYRNKGLLRKLDEIAVNELKKSGISYLELNTIASNKMANDAWSKLGYKVFRQQWRKDISG